MWHKAMAWTSRSEVQGVNRLTIEGLLHLWFPFISSTVHVGRKTILWPKFHVDQDVQMPNLHSKCCFSSLSLSHPHYFAFTPNFFALFASVAQLAASSLGRSGDGAGKGRRACNYVSGIWISASKKSMWKLCWLAEMTLVMTSLPLSCVFNLCLHLRSFTLCTYWQNLTVEAQLTGNHWGIGGGIQIKETFLQALLPSFLPYRLQ